MVAFRSSVSIRIRNGAMAQGAKRIAKTMPREKMPGRVWNRTARVDALPFTRGKREQSQLEQSYKYRDKTRDDIDKQP
jgi:hypothetical protein